jgi:hypothetical protein
MGTTAPGFWRRQNISKRSVLGILESSIAGLFSKYPSSLPDLRPPTTVVVTSDYSGEHQGATHEVLSFLVADLDACGPWDVLRAKARREFLGDGRRMSFKDLRDRRRQLALPAFLDAANSLSGLSFTVAISKEISTLFDGPRPLDLANPEFSEFREWAPRVLEKTFRVVHLLSFLLAGLLRADQNVLWFTDEDAIAAKPARVASLVRLVAWISSGYLTFDLGHLRCGTTACDDGSRRIEDLASIPDLVAGAVAEQLVIDAAAPVIPPGQVFWVYRSDFSPKSSVITRWLADTKPTLKRLVVRLDQARDSPTTIVSWYHFHDQTGA